MELKPIDYNISALPERCRPYLENAQLFDSSCFELAQTLFIDKEQGYFLKIAPKGSLADEALMTKYFHGKRLSASVDEYVSEDRDYLITERITGQDGTTKRYLDDPVKLCDVFSQSLRMLHETDASDCPRLGRTTALYNKAERIYHANNNTTWLLDYMHISSVEEAYRLMKELIPLFCEDVLQHGDYCLPNILLNDFKFSGFIDVGYSGIGDRHFDIFWGIWTLQHNLHTDRYTDRFLDGYGRDKVDMDRLKLNGILAALTD